MGSAHRHLEAEIGDLLFAVTNLARKCGCDPEVALAECNERFIRRFAHVEEGLENAGKSLNEASLDEMEVAWQEAKGKEQ